MLNDRWRGARIGVLVAAAACGPDAAAPDAATPLDATAPLDAATTRDAGPPSDAAAAELDGAFPDAGRAPADASPALDGSVPPSEGLRMLLLLVDHNGQGAPPEAESLAELAAGDRHFQRNSCGAIHFEGLDEPSAPGDVATLDVGWLRPACDVDSDCTRGSCSYDPAPGDGRPEGRCPCTDDVASAAFALARERYGDRFADYDAIGAVYRTPQPWLACPPSQPCHSLGRVWTCREVNWHEIGHSIGFHGHANRVADAACYQSGEFGCDSIEYGDAQDIMGADSGRRGLTAMGLARLMGAGWVRGQVPSTRGGTFCVHPFDPPITDWEPFCAESATVRGVELDLARAPLDDDVQVGLRGQSGELQLWESRPGGTRGSTLLLASLRSEGERFEAQPVLLDELERPYRLGFSVERGPVCEGDGVEVTVRVDE